MSSAQIAAELEALRAKRKTVQTRLNQVNAARSSIPSPVDNAVDAFNEKQREAYKAMVFGIEGISHVSDVAGELSSRSEGYYYDGYDGMALVAQNLNLETQRLEQRIAELDSQIAAKEQELIAAQQMEAALAQQAAMAAAAAAAAAEAEMGSAGGR